MSRDIDNYDETNYGLFLKGILTTIDNKIVSYKGCIDMLNDDMVLFVYEKGELCPWTGYSYDTIINDMNKNKSFTDKYGVLIDQINDFLKDFGIKESVKIENRKVLFI